MSDFPNLPPMPGTADLTNRVKEAQGALEQALLETGAITEFNFHAVPMRADEVLKGDVICEYSEGHMLWKVLETPLPEVPHAPMPGQDPPRQPPYIHIECNRWHYGTTIKGTGNQYLSTRAMPGQTMVLVDRRYADEE